MEGRHETSSVLFLLYIDRISINLFESDDHHFRRGFFGGSVNMPRNLFELDGFISLDIWKLPKTAGITVIIMNIFNILHSRQDGTMNL